MTIPADIAAPALFALGCAMLTMMLLRRSYRYFGKKRNRNDPPIDAQPRPKNGWTGAHADATARIERQKVELHEYGRDVSAQIDSKLVLLNQLVAKSQSQIDRLETLLAEAEKREPLVGANKR